MTKLYLVGENRIGFLTTPTFGESDIAAFPII